MVLQTPLEPAAGRKHFVLFSLWKCFQEDAFESGKEPSSSATAGLHSRPTAPCGFQKGMCSPVVFEEEADISGVSSSQCWSATNSQ